MKTKKYYVVGPDKHAIEERWKKNKNNRTEGKR